VRGILWKNASVPGSDLPYFKVGDVISGCSIKKNSLVFYSVAGFFPHSRAQWTLVKNSGNILLYYPCYGKKADYPQ